MKVYLAAPYSWRLVHLKAEREKFRLAGFDVTSQWIDNGEEWLATQHDAAQMDLDDIDRADLFVLFTLPYGTMFYSGGRMVELGYAMAKGKTCFIIGERENVFCHHSSVTQCNDVHTALAKMTAYKAEVEAKMKMAMSSFMDRIDDALTPKEDDGGEFKHPGRLF